MRSGCCAGKTAVGHPAVPLLRNALSSSCTVLEEPEPVGAAVRLGRQWRERHVLAVATHMLLRDCKLLQVERLLPSAVAAHAFAYSVAELSLDQGDAAQLTELMSQAGDEGNQPLDCWQRPCKRSRVVSSALKQPAGSSAAAAGGQARQAQIPRQAQISAAAAHVRAAGIGPLTAEEKEQFIEEAGL